MICSSPLAMISCANRLRHFRKSWYCSRLRILRERNRDSTGIMTQ